MDKIEETELSVVTATLDLRIQDFLSATKVVCEYHSKNYKHCNIYFSATVFPDEDWLSVRPCVIVYNDRRHSVFNFSKWAVSIIDIEGSTRLTRYFEYPYKSFRIGERNEFPSESVSLSQVLEKCSGENFVEARYLEKSFILNRADEFLFDGTLFLRCDIYFDFDAIKKFLFIDDGVILSDTFKIFMHTIPQSVCYKNDAESGNSRDTCAVFDLTAQVLTLPQFHELRKRFGIYGISPEIASPNSESKEDITDILENVWIFDTHPDRFLLSLARHSGNVGRLLVNASPVIRRCVKAPMKEHREKRVKFPNVDSLIFKIVLHFLISGELYNYSDAIVEVYKFSHMYEMVNLQQKCAEYIMWGSETETEFEKIEKMAGLYSDDYLFRLLQSHKREKIEQSDTYVKEDKPNFDYYN